MAKQTRDERKKDRQPPSRKSPRPPRRKRMRDDALARKIRELRGALNLTLTEFAKWLPDNVRVHWQRLSAIEHGETPRHELLVHLGNKAPDPAMRRFFFEKAGIKFETLKTDVRDEFLERYWRTPGSDAEAHLNVFRDFDALRREKPVASVPLPGESIYAPENTLCLQLSDQSARSRFVPGIFEAGDVILIDLARTSLFADVCAGGRPIETPRTGKPESTGRTQSVQLWAVFIDAPPDEGEYSQPHAPVRFGWMSIVEKGEPQPVEDATSHVWCLGLRPAVAKGINENAKPVPLTEWVREGHPTDEEIRRHLLKGVHVLGAVVGHLPGKHRRVGGEVPSI